MAELSLAVIIGGVTALLFGGVVKGLTGIGLPLFSLPILAYFIPVPLAMSLLTLPSMVTSAWQAVQGGNTIAALRRVWPLLIGVAAGCTLTARMLVSIDLHTLYLILGVLVVAFASILNFRVVFDVPPAREGSIGLAAGLIAGAIGGVSMLFGPIYTLYLSGMRMDKEFFVVAVSLANLVAAGSLMLALANLKIMGGAELAGSLAATVPVIMGMFVGQCVRTRLSEVRFRKALALVLLAVGLSLIRKAFV